MPTRRLNAEASVAGGRKMAAAVLERLGKDHLGLKRWKKGVRWESKLTAFVDFAGGLWMQNLRGKLALR